MGLRLPTLILIGAASVTGAAAMYVLPDTVAGSHGSVVASAEASPARAPAGTLAEPVDGTAKCTAETWPYISADCAAAKQAAMRQVRIISTGRDAPRLVPLPASVRAASLEAAPADAAPAVSDADGIATMAMLPPARPADLSPAAEGAVTAQAGDIDATGSVTPADDKMAKKAAAARQRIARARQRDYGRVRAAYAEAQAGDDLGASGGPSVYRYSDGREVIVRPDYDAQPRRVVASRESYEAPRSYAERRQPTGLLGALFGSF